MFKTLSNLFTGNLNHKRILFWAMLFFVLADVGDIVTSYYAPFGILEANQFAQDIFGRFDLAKGIRIKSWAFLFIGIFSWFLFQGFKRVSVELGYTVASLPYWYYGSSVLLGATLPNLFFILRYHLP